jgi:Tol biopolymer transport system component/C-terminal processing protease CtpA/Prc
MPRALAAVLLALGTVFASSPALAADEPVTPDPPLAQPSLSPDGSTIVFASGGDLWTVPAAGGTARLLVADPATESRPLFSPDGHTLAFVSTRTGNGDIYLLALGTGELRRLTWDDEGEQLDAWSRDGRWIYFSSPAHDIAGRNDLFRVSPEGGTPLEVVAERYIAESFAAPSPDGHSIAFTALGIANSQWWRHGHSHIDESEIWLWKDGAERKVSGGDFKNLWPMWSADGRSLLFVSDRSGAENLWRTAAVDTEDTASPAEPVTRFADGRVLWPSISLDGRTVVFERGFHLWKADTASGATAEVPIRLEGAPAGPVVAHREMSDGFQELALSPDGKKVAFVAHGDVFAAASKPPEDGGNDAVRLSETLEAESQPAWAPDSRRLVYASEREGARRLYLYDFSTRREERLTDGDLDHSPVFSPDGKSLAFLRGRSELHVLDLASRRDRTAAPVAVDMPPLGASRPIAWSPDGRWLAVVASGQRLFHNVYVVPAAGGKLEPVSFLGNVFADSVAWSPDGRSLYFVTGQQTERSQVARVDLVPRVPRFREESFRALFEETPSDQPGKPAETKKEKTPTPKEKKSPQPDAAPPAEKPEPVEIVFAGIRDRLTFLPLDLDAGALALAPDGKSVVLTAAAAGQVNLWSVSIDELADEPPVPKQLTSTAGDKGVPQISPDGKQVFYLENSAIKSVPADGSADAAALDVTAALDVDFAREKAAVFDQAWRMLRDNFYDPKMHGVDWEAARRAWLPRIAGSRTPDEERRVISQLVGELNASHLGISPASSATVTTTGRLGLRFDRAAYETQGKLRISEVIPLGPADVAGDVHEGDWLLAVDGQEVGARTNLEQLLDHRIGEEVRLTLAAGSGSGPGNAKREVRVRPVSLTTERGLTYRAWVASRREIVRRASNGRLGYVHLYDMSDDALRQLAIDLDTENQSREGVVVDVRNNRGGNVNVYALDVLSRRGYLQMTYRGFEAAPARTILGQRALERPTVLVTDRHTLSDGEDFAEGYRALGLGKIVGEPTAGWIIYTSNIDLLDGSSLRVPFIRITDARGNDMEMHPRPVDVPVDWQLGQGKDHDAQLEAAVKVLLGE